MYSERYKQIRKKAEKWPEWKIKAYNESIAVSKNARKLELGDSDNAISKKEERGRTSEDIQK